ncbi:Chloramphenicol acetyltransferase [Bordetella trematum]|nr:Chloramphenicol acetyltransferase [Bordetella trematum]VDH06752.1 Chloramphenicol acetyltransferase [Bordetella trematum]
MAGNPAREGRRRFEPAVIERLLALEIYGWEAAKFEALKPYLCASDLDALCEAAARYDAACGDCTSACVSQSRAACTAGMGAAWRR